MHEKLQTSYAKRIMKKRGSTVEPVLGTMLNFLNLKRVNTRGIKAANKHIMMSAIAYNLKKLIKFSRSQVNSIAIALQQAEYQMGNTIRFFVSHFKRPIASIKAT
jgi:hypothetical protein